MAVSGTWTSASAQEVQAAITRVIPDPGIRMALLEYLADAIEYAHSCNPNVWVLSFRDAKELRLISGPTRTVTVRSSGLFVTVMDEHLPEDQLETVLAFDEKWAHKNLPASHNLGILQNHVLESIPIVRQANFAAIRISSDIMRRTIYRKSHAPAAVDYLEQELGRVLPRPDFEPSSSRAWKISVGNNRRRLEEAQQHGIIGLDFERAHFDLSDLPTTSNDDFQDALAERGVPHDNVVNRAPVQLWTFLAKVRPGDRVYLYSEQAFHSSGVVTGDYHFEGDTDAFAHRRLVNWILHGHASLGALPVTLSDRVRNAWATLEELTEDEADRIDALIAGDEDIPGEEIDSGPPIPWQQTYARLFPAAGLHYTPWQQAVFFTALQTKGFVILSGISGTGKTKIAQAFAAALPRPSDGRNVAFLTVRPDWRDSKSLIGYHNPITDRYERTPFLEFLLRAVESWQRRDGLAWFVILDEMNLAHVEHYFAELLSILESGRDASGWTNEAIQLPVSASESKLPDSIKLPPNLFLIGTVNLDETTHAFSPKVLDRAFAMEFSEVSFDHYAPGMRPDEAVLSEPARQTLLDALSGNGAFPRIDRNAITALLAHDERPRQWLGTLNRLLEPHHMHFAYRVFDEIMAFVDLGLKNGLFAGLNGSDPLETAFDAAVLMKVLPKFHGSRARLEVPLSKVLAWCLDPAIPNLYEIRTWMDQAATSDDLERSLLDLAYRFPETAKRAARLLWSAQVDGFAAFG